jgi:uncharacterized protein (TIGR02594 family)
MKKITARSGKMGADDKIKIVCTEEEEKAIVTCELTHTVVKDAYAYSIYTKYGMTLKELKQCNKNTKGINGKLVLPNGVDGDFVLNVGDVLNVKGKAISARVVKGGDILPKEDSCPPWVKIAKNEMKTKENDDATKMEPRIGEYYKASDYYRTGMDDDLDDDAWCGAFLAWVMIKAGYTPPKGSITAKNWLNFGEEDDDIYCGSIVIKDRNSKGHVSMAVGQDKSGKWIYALGGNQDDRVKMKFYPREVWISKRSPKEYKGKKIPLPTITNAFPPSSRTKIKYKEN